jgi:hypothetical protein
MNERLNKLTRSIELRKQIYDVKLELLGELDPSTKLIRSALEIDETEAPEVIHFSAMINVYGAFSDYIKTITVEDDSSVLDAISNNVYGQMISMHSYIKNLKKNLSADGIYITADKVKDITPRDIYELSCSECLTNILNIVLHTFDNPPLSVPT